MHSLGVIRSKEQMVWNRIGPPIEFPSWNVVARALGIVQGHAAPPIDSSRWLAPICQVGNQRDAYRQGTIFR